MRPPPPARAPPPLAARLLVDVDVLARPRALEARSNDPLPERLALDIALDRCDDDTALPAERAADPAAREASSPPSREEPFDTAPLDGVRDVGREAVPAEGRVDAVARDVPEDACRVDAVAPLPAPARVDPP